MRKWPWFVLSFLVMLAIPATYLLYQVPVYKVHASLLIKEKINDGKSMESPVNELSQLKVGRSIEDEIEILKSYTLMDRVVKNLGLDVRYYHSTGSLQDEIYAASPIRLIIENANPNLYTSELKFSFLTPKSVVLNGITYPISHSIRTPYGQFRVLPRKPLTSDTQPVVVNVSLHSKAVNACLSKLKVEPVSKQSGVVEISLVEAVPDKGEAILNQLIDEYTRKNLLEKSNEARTMLDFIEERLVLIAGELSLLEREAEANKSIGDSTYLGKQTHSFLTVIKRNDAQLSEVNRKLSGLAVIERYARNQDGIKRSEQAAAILSDPIVSDLVEHVSQLERKREAEARTGTGKSPLLSVLDRQLKEAKSGIYKSCLTLRKQLTYRYNQLLASNRRIENMIRSIPSKGQALLAILRQPVVKNGLYTYLVQKREGAALATISSVLDSCIVDAARTDEIPVELIPKEVFVLFGIFGLLLPIVFFGIKSVLNNRVKRRDDVERFTQVPILGEIVMSPQIAADNLVFKPRMQSVIGEQIRALRASLQLLRTDARQSQVILFTSCISGEGKSLISLNLGVSLALINRTTVILEMDLRKPSLHKNLHLENRVGISNYLLGEATITELVQPIPGYDNYFIATAGPLPPNPAELLSSSRLGQLFYELKERFDHIIVDSPPIGLVADSQLIAPFADTTLFVVRHDHTPKNCVKMIESLYLGNRFPNLHIILNAVGKGEMRYYTDYDSDYTAELMKARG